MSISNILLQRITVIYIILVFTVSVIPIGGIGTSISNNDILSLRIDYLLHALVFLPFVALWKCSFPDHSLWLIIPLGLVFAAVMEIIQYWIPYRSYNINDLIGNVLGIVIGILIYPLFKPFFKKTTLSKCQNSFQ